MNNQPADQPADKTESPDQPRCACNLDYPPRLNEFLPGLLLPFIPYSFPSKVNPECQVHGTGTLYARVEGLSEALHEGDWSMQAGEWRWTEASDARRLATRVLVESFCGNLTDGGPGGNLHAQVATSYATRTSRGGKPLDGNRTQAKVEAFMKALNRLMVEERRGGVVDPNACAECGSSHGSCPSHCCPTHGCKYGDDCCPVETGRIAPEYRSNNGCEECEDDEEMRATYATQDNRS